MSKNISITVIGFGQVNLDPLEYKALMACVDIGLRTALLEKYDVVNTHVVVATAFHHEIFSPYGNPDLVIIYNGKNWRLA